MITLSSSCSESLYSLFWAACTLYESWCGLAELQEDMLGEAGDECQGENVVVEVSVVRNVEVRVEMGNLIARLNVIFKMFW